MRIRRAAYSLPALLLVLAPLAWSAPPDASAPPTDKDRPSISLKASPTIAFSPARVVFTADLRGGANDYEQYYCSTVEWDWGDGTTSEHTVDCEPYEAGKSEIKRHYVTDRVFRLSGEYRVQFRLKKNDKVLGAGSTLVKIRPGVREIGGGGE
jgi:hypothetical protein